MRGAHAAGRIDVLLMERRNMSDMNAPHRSGIGSGVWWIIGVLAVATILWMLFAMGTPAPA